MLDRRGSDCLLVWLVIGMFDPFFLHSIVDEFVSTVVTFNYHLEYVCIYIFIYGIVRN